MRIRAVAATAAVALAASIAGCGLLGDDDASTPATTTTTEAPTTTVVPAADPEVLDPGAEPRTPLRLTLTEGATTTLAFTTDVAITQEGEDGRRQRLDSPPITQWITYEVVEVGPDGAQVDLEVVAAFVEDEGTGLADDDVAELDAALAQVVGLTGTASFGDRGQVREAAFTGTEDLLPAVAAQVEGLEGQLAALGPPLPVEAVGVGAVWEATTSVSLQGATIDTTATYTVTAIDDGSVSYEATIDQRAEPQDLDGAGLGDDVEVRLVDVDGSGTATGTQRLDSLGLELTTRIETDQDLEIDEGRGARALTQSVTSATSVRTPDP